MSKDYTLGSVSFYGQSDSFLSPILEPYYNSKKRIGVVHWWDIQQYVYRGASKEGTRFNPEYDVEFLEKLNDIEAFVSGVDVCIVISEEMMGTSCPGTWLRRKLVYDMFDQYNTAYVTFGVEPLMPSGDRCFNYLWMCKNTPIYPSKEFQPTWDYKPKQYTFNMMLGSDKQHRTHLFHTVGSENDKIYSTYFGQDELKHLSDTHLEDEEILENLTNQITYKRKLNTLEDVSAGPISRIIPEKIYNHSHFDIVSETWLDHGFFFATEKTSKPLSTGRWFISYVTHKHFEFLEKWGFDFSDYQIDYDVKENTYRLDLVVKKIKEINEDTSLVKHIYSETKANRRHNKQVYNTLHSRIHQDLTEFVKEMVL